MSSLREVWARLLSLFRRQELDRDFDEELASHIELAVDDNLRRGMTASPWAQDDGESFGNCLSRA